MNQDLTHVFVEGLKSDYSDQIESNKSYFLGENGRLYSENGTISFSSIKGTKQIYENQNIVKYLGGWGFEDELICFLKILPEIDGGTGTIIYEDVTNINLASFIVTVPYDEIEETIDLNPHVTINEYSVPTYVPPPNISFENIYSCSQNDTNEIDLSEYFIENSNVPNFQNCELTNELDEFENNKDFLDCIMSLKKNENGIVYSTILWIGYQNWPLNAKIVCYGLFENNNYKRVYYTNYYNPLKVVNIKDKSLSSRKGIELNLLQNTNLLQPKIENIGTNGQIKAGTVFYCYRLITANGQVTEFSPFSFGVKIVKEENGFEFSGGTIDEITNKNVDIKINVLNYKFFNEIEVIAVEFQAKDVPTAIRRLGIKPLSEINYFTHFGNEPEFDSNITISDLVERKNNFIYCSDITSNSNMLFVAGTRNNPIPSELLQTSEEFALHSWDINGETHNCLLNPNPDKYRYIDPNNTDSLFYVKQKLYNSISVFGSFTVKIVNENTGDFFEKSFDGSLNQYMDFTLEIYNWLEELINTSSFGFNLIFPNLTFELNQNKLIFKPINNLINTDFSLYNFQYNTNQVIENIEKDIQFINLSVNPASLIYGAVSLGFNSGNGIRITYKTELEEVLTKATGPFETNKPLLNLKEPNFKKSFFKGDIYRLGLSIKGNQGEDLFVIPLGDVLIPKHGELKKGLDDSGFPFYSSEYYKNSRVINDKLYAEKTTMRIEVRLSCKLQKLISSYQLVYVERTPENRGVLAQGISAPMERCQTFFHSSDVSLNDKINQKWCLPYYGGPTYDDWGLKQYDIDPEDVSNVRHEWKKRIITHRAMFYFDSPDFIFNQIDEQLIRSCKANPIARLNTDHSSVEIRDTPEGPYPKFSRKIYKNEIKKEGNYKPRYVSVSVFSNERKFTRNSIPIKFAERLEEGQILSGFKFDTAADVSNNAMTLGKQPWFYSSYARTSKVCKLDNGIKSELFNSNNYSIGKNTIVIKTDEDLFTNNFIDQIGFTPSGEVRLAGGLKTYDTHALINIENSNRLNLYGGKSELAYASNVYIPIGETIPVLKNTNGSQIFTCYGDTYTTLFIRNKNYFSDLERGRKNMNNSGGCEDRHEEEDYPRTGAWSYAVVLETMLEPKLQDENVFYKANDKIDFEIFNEKINEAYFQEKALKSYIPKPFRFIDDPDQSNIVAVSKVKLNGDYYDAWSEFPINNFYELEKNHGPVLNLSKLVSKVFAVQKTQNSELIINPQTFINTSDGQEILIKQGDGSPIVDHRIISQYGTSIRRAVANNELNEQTSGYTFFDELKNEFIKNGKPMFVEKDLFLKMNSIFKTNKVINTEAYFDPIYKETNIQVTTKNNDIFVISYNELFQVFNGIFTKYNNDIFINWNNDIFVPKKQIVPFNSGQRLSNQFLHQLNEGNILQFFDEYTLLKLGIITSMKSNISSIFPHFSSNVNINYPIKRILIKTSSGQTRIIEGTHHRYFIREGIHSVPLKNRNDWDDLRGNWCEIIIEIENIDNNKIDVFSITNFVRNSKI